MTASFRSEALVQRPKHVLIVYCDQVVIIQPLDTGSKSHPFPHALVAGIERYPSQITRRMSKVRQAKRSKVKPFIKTINYNHLMPTRYTLELEGLKGVVTNDTFKEVSQREEAKKMVKKVLEERYTSGKNRWFFTQLSECTRSRPPLRAITFTDFEMKGFERFKFRESWHVYMNARRALAVARIKT